MILNQDNNILGALEQIKSCIRPNNNKRKLTIKPYYKWENENYD